MNLPSSVVSLIAKSSLGIEKLNKMLSYCRETALQAALVWPKVEELGDILRTL